MTRRKQFGGSVLEAFPPCTSQEDEGGHYFQNAAQHGQRIDWTCSRCGVKREPHSG